MFVGHYAASLALKAADQRVPLAPLFLGAQVLDIVSAAFVLLGIEHWRIVPGITAASPLALDVPYTHGFFTSLGWALLAYLVVRVVPLPKRIPRRKTAFFVGLAVWSHWWLDLIVHKPDLPIYDHTLYLGLGLWYSRPGTWIVETALLVAALVYYVRTSTARNAAGRFGMLVFVVLLVAINTANLYGPPPASSNAVAIAGEIFYVAAALIALWLARYRAARVRRTA
ncbi:MAG TPA: hypothetical protein VGC72_14175 [Candidatus Elarobacter sp.]